MAKSLVGSRSGVLIVASLLCFGAISPYVRAACAAPTVVVLEPKPQSEDVASLGPATRATVRGLYWLKGCDDTGGGAAGGCGGEEPAEPSGSYKDIEVRVAGPVTERVRKTYSAEGVVGRTRYAEVVGIADADSRGRFTLSFRVPDLPPGMYYLMGSEPGGPTLIRISKP
jgi:hypothetical protein